MVRWEPAGPQVIQQLLASIETRQQGSFICGFNSQDVQRWNMEKPSAMVSRAFVVTHADLQQPRPGTAA